MCAKFVSDADLLSVTRAEMIRLGLKKEDNPMTENNNSKDLTLEELRKIAAGGDAYNGPLQFTKDGKAVCYFCGSTNTRWDHKGG